MRVNINALLNGRSAKQILIEMLLFHIYNNIYKYIYIFVYVCMHVYIFVIEISTLLYKWLEAVRL